MKVYSLSLFRHAASNYEHPNCGDSRGRFFTNCLPSLVKAFRANYPGWQLRIHHDETLFQGAYGDMLCRLQGEGMLQLIYMGRAETLCGSMLWRMAPLWDPQVDYLVCRDVDSLPMPRERIMLEQFIASGRAVNALLDSESHCGPLMGGMIAFNVPKVHQLMPMLKGMDVHSLYTGTFAAGLDFNQHGTDQLMLNREFWPYLMQDALVHQRKNIVQHASAGETMPAAPQSTERDRIVNHVGAGYDLVAATNAYASEPTTKEIVEVENRMSPQTPVDRKVILSCDLNESYYAYLPLTCAAWRNIGYQPVVLLIGEPTEWLSSASARLALMTARAIGAQIHFLAAIEGHRTSTQAQVARLLAGCLQDDPGTYYLISDMDMWPMQHAWFRQRDTHAVQIFGSNLTDSKYNMCYVGANHETWKQFRRTFDPDEIYSPRVALGMLLKERDQGTEAEAWNLDETLLTEWLLRDEMTLHLQHIDRQGRDGTDSNGYAIGAPVDRYDRSDPHNRPIGDSEMVDAHLTHEPWAHYTLLADWFEHAVPGYRAWAAAYLSRFEEARG